MAQTPSAAQFYAWLDQHPIRRLLLYLEQNPRHMPDGLNLGPHDDLLLDEFDLLARSAVFPQAPHGQEFYDASIADVADDHGDMVPERATAAVDLVSATERAQQLSVSPAWAQLDVVDLVEPTRWRAPDGTWRAMIERKAAALGMGRSQEQALLSAVAMHVETVRQAVLLSDPEKGRWSGAMPEGFWTDQDVLIEQLTTMATAAGLPAPGLEEHELSDEELIHLEGWMLGLWLQAHGHVVALPPTPGFL